MISQSIEDYVKTIYHLQLEKEKVTTKAISEEMGISSASVTGMVKKLASMDILTHTPYRETALTSRGEKIALQMIRRHRLLESFLKEVLGYPLDRVHDEAERLEHVISEEFVERMDDVLGNPSTDPHGSPIPNPQGEMLEQDLFPLLDLESGQSAVVLRVSHRDPDKLRYMEKTGILPGTNLTVLDRRPFKGPMMIQIGDEKKEMIGHEIARQIWVGYGKPDRK
ncbi:MAG: metal-dependent transcriptional regulator [Fidelibacterota bacterium]